MVGGYCILTKYTQVHVCKYALETTRHRYTHILENATKTCTYTHTHTHWKMLQRHAFHLKPKEQIECHTHKRSGSKCVRERKRPTDHEVGIAGVMFAHPSTQNYHAGVDRVHGLVVHPPQI